MSIQPDEGLKRVLGVPTLVATVLNNTIGAGIYALPAIVAMQMGAAGILGYVFCYLIFFAIVLCYLEVGSRITSSGGSYAYVEAAFGHFPGFIINSIFFFGWGIIGDAAVLNILADSLSVIYPVFAQPLVRALLFFTLIGGMALINVRGAKEGVAFVVFLTIVKLLPLFFIIFFGFSHIQVSNLHWQHFPPLKSFGDTALVLFFTIAGFETSLNSSGEIKNPKRTIPKGILLGTFLMLIIYSSIQLVAQGVLGAQLSQYKDAPLAAVAETIVGPIGATLLLIATMISSFGNTSGDILSTPRLLFAGAKNGLFPKYLGKMHPKFATPYWAILTYCGLIFIFSVSGGFKQLAILASASLLLIYLSVVLSMIRLRFKKTEETEKAFKVPCGLIIPIIAVVAILWMLCCLTKNEIISIALFIGVLCVIYFVMNKLKPGKTA